MQLQVIQQPNTRILLDPPQVKKIEGVFFIKKVYLSTVFFTKVAHVNCQRGQIEAWNKVKPSNSVIVELDS